jgi:hypothetical protein
VAPLGVAGLGDLFEELVDGLAVDIEVAQYVAGAGCRHPLRAGTDRHPDDFRTDLLARALLGSRRAGDDGDRALSRQFARGGVLANDEVRRHPDLRGRGVIVFL